MQWQIVPHVFIGAEILVSRYFLNPVYCFLADSNMLVCNIPMKMGKRGSRDEGQPSLLLLLILAMLLPCFE